MAPFDSGTLIQRVLWNNSKCKLSDEECIIHCRLGKIVSGSLDGLVRIWNGQLGMDSKQGIRGHSEKVFDVAIIQDCLRVASASQDGAVRLWDVRTGRQIGVYLEGHSKEANCVAFSPDGRWVVSGSNDNTPRLWNTEAYIQVGDPFKGHSSGISCVSFSLMDVEYFRDPRKEQFGYGMPRRMNNVRNSIWECCSLRVRER